MSWKMTPKAPDIYDKTKRRTKDVPENETDVNKIVSRFMKTGQLPSDSREPAFADVSPYAGGLLAAHQHISKMAKVSQEQFNAERAEFEARKAAAAKPPVIPPQGEGKGGEK